MEQPIEDQHVVAMNAVAEVLSDTFKGYGFTLLVFDVNSTEPGRMNYICNCNREDMVVAMKEFIAHNEGRAMPLPEAKQ